MDHFEVRDENDKVVFDRSASGEQIFTDLGISETGYPGHPQLFTVSVERKTNADDRASSIWYVYYFHPTPAGLTAFQSALSCGEGSGTLLSNLNLWPPGGMAVGCEFDAGYFRFTAELEFDFDHHQIVANPTRGRLFHVGDSDKVSAKAATVTALRVYREHDKNAQQFTVRIARGQVTPLSAAWVPVFLRTSGDVAIAGYDPDKLWLQVELKNQTVWIQSDESFRAIGLDHLAAVK